MQGENNVMWGIRMPTASEVVRRALSAIGGIAIADIPDPLQHQHAAGGDWEADLKDHAAAAATTGGSASARDAEVIVIGHMYAQTAALMLAIVMAAMAASDQRIAAVASEFGAKFALAALLLSYAVLSAFAAAAKDLTRGAALASVMCMAAAWGDCARVLAPRALASPLARAVAFAAAMEAISAAARAFSGPPEGRWGRYARRIAMATLAARVVALLLMPAASGTAWPFTVLDCAEPPALAVLCWALWSGGRVGRTRVAWLAVVAGCACAFVGRALGIAAGPASLGAMAARQAGMHLAALQYARVCATAIRAAGVSVVTEVHIDPI